MEAFWRVRVEHAAARRGIEGGASGGSVGATLRLPEQALGARATLRQPRVRRLAVGLAAAHLRLVSRFQLLLLLLVPNLAVELHCVHSAEILASVTW